jgi:hypothetical protein
MKTCAAPEKGAINPKPFSSFQDANFPLSRISGVSHRCWICKEPIKVPRAALRNPVRIPDDVWRSRSNKSGRIEQFSRLTGDGPQPLSHVWKHLYFSLSKRTAAML